MNSRLLLTVVVLSLLALLALIGLQRALEEAVEQREASPPVQEDAPPRPEGGAGDEGAREAESRIGSNGVAYEILLAKTDETQAVRDSIARRFLADQQKAGLPPLEIPLSDFDMQAFHDSLCAGVSERLERDGFR